MEFGRVQIHELPGVDFTLPPDTALTRSTLKAAKGSGECQVHVGCAKWGRKEWRGKIYPARTREANFLDEYVHHFDCIELNATFYQIYGPETTGKWRKKSAANKGFKYCPKFPGQITQMRRLKNAEELTARFYQGIMSFGDQLGPLFLQVGENFTPKGLPELEAYLQHLPTEVPVFVEVRHKDWFALSDCRDHLFKTLAQLGIGAVITDAAGRRDCVHMELPMPHAFIRFVGNSLDKTDYSRIDDWVARIGNWKRQGLQSVWFFMHQHDERYSPELCDYLLAQLNDALGLDLKRPRFILREKGMLEQ